MKNGKLRITTFQPVNEIMNLSNDHQSLSKPLVEKADEKFTHDK